MISWPETQLVLTEDELVLRPTVPSDAPVMFHYISGDEDIAEFTTVPSPYEMSHAAGAVERWAEGFDNQELMQWAITINDGPIIGQISLQGVILIDHNAEIGYLLAREARGSGIMARAIELVSDYAFAIGFRRLQAKVMIENIASAKSLLRAGFEQEAILKNYMTKRNGEQTDALLFAKFSDF